ncbi:MAG: response regulator, partial [Treponema sp.]|nr:response regulator [Treponema sp.]
MQEKEYVNYFLLRNKAHRITIFLTWIIGFALLLAMEIKSPFSDVGESEFSYNIVKYCTEMVLVIMATSLSGWMVGALIVFQLFAALSIMKYPQFHTFILLNLSILANIPVMYGSYKKLWKTILLFFGFTAFMVLGSIFVWWLTEKPISIRKEVIMYAITIGIACTCNYIFANFLPENVRKLFFGSSYYSAKVQTLRFRLRSHKYTRSIGGYLTFLIVGEAFFIILSAYGWSNGFFQHVVADIIGSEEALRTMFKFLVNMLMTTVPVILLGISYSNVQISNPLMLMAAAIKDSYKSSLSNESSMEEIYISDLKLNHKNEIGVLYNCIQDSIDNMSDYIEKEKQKQQLASELASANAASKAKTEFLSNMSHEIRTPINTVLGLDEIILRESKEPAIRTYAKDIQSAGNSLLSLVNDILDFSKIEAGKMDIIPVIYEIGSAVNDLVNMVSSRAEDKDLALNVNVDPNIPSLLIGDVERLKQCILNLLTNAIKYTEKGSVGIKISYKKINEDSIMLSVCVKDTGIGIKEEDLGKLFTEFQRIEEKRNRKIEGTGLGLNIVQRILALMNSMLNVKSVYGEGSEFSFELKQNVQSWKPMGDFCSAYKKSLDVENDYHESFHAPEARILIVDDTVLNLLVVKGLLKNTQMQIDAVESGMQALDLVKEHHYDIIFLDHLMPQMDGIETFHAMQLLEGNKCMNVPCISLTANAIYGAREMYLQEGFTDYLTKPIDSKKLEQMIVKYLPKEKVVRLEECNYEQDDCCEFKGLHGIELSEALKNCGDVEIFKSALKNFYDSIDDKVSEIEKFTKTKDWKNYTILVHALKSSARLIGALTLSKDAEYLEKCGNDMNESEIQAKTPELLSLYRSYKDRLASVVNVSLNIKKEG